MSKDIVLGIKILADGKSVALESSKVNQSLGGIGKEADKASRGADKLAESLKRIGHYGSATVLGVAGINQLTSGFSELLSTATKFNSITKGLQTVTGSAQAAGKQYQFLQKVSQELGLSLADIASSYVNLSAAAKGSALQGKDTEQIFIAVSRSMAALGKSSADTEGALLAVSQMISKGTITAEELRGQLSERLPGAFNAMARAVGVSTAELSKMLEQGQVGLDVLPRFAQELNKISAAGDFTGISNNVNRLGNEWNNLKKSLADAAPINDGLNSIASAMQGVNANIETLINTGKTVLEVFFLFGAGRLIGGIFKFIGGLREAQAATTAVAAAAELAAKKTGPFGEAIWKSQAAAVSVAEKATLAETAVGLFGKTAGYVAANPLTALTTMLSGAAIAFVNFSDKAAEAKSEFNNEAIAQLNEQIAAKKFALQGNDPASPADQLGFRLANGQNMADAQNELRMLEIKRQKLIELHAFQQRVKADEAQDDQEAIRQTQVNKLLAETEDWYAETVVADEKKIRDEKKKSADHAKSLAESSTKAYANEREEVAKTLASIQFETDLIGKSSTERARAIELTQALTKAKGAEREAITQALQAQWAQIDATQRQNAMWEEAIKQANALDELKDSAAESVRLANIANELKLQGATNEQIKQRIDLEKQLLSAQQAAPDADKGQVAAYVTQRANAEKTLAEIADEANDSSAKKMETAYKRAIENIQDAMADMFESVLNGDALKSFDDFFGSLKKMFNKLLAQDLATSIQDAFKNGISGSKGGSSSGGLLSGLFDGISSLLSSNTGAKSQAAASGGFQGNGMLLSYMNPATSSSGGGLLSSIGSLFTSGSSSSGGGFLSNIGKLFSGGGSGGAVSTGLVSMLLQALGGNSKIGSMASTAGTALSALGWLASQGSGLGSFISSGLLSSAGGVLGGFGAGTTAGNLLGKLAFSSTNKNDINLGSMGGAAAGTGAAMALGLLGGGPLGLLLGGILGGAGGGLLGGLFGSKIPQPTEWTQGAYKSGNLSIVKSGAYEGGNVKNTIDFTNSFGVMIKKLGSQLNMSFSDFTTKFWHQLDDQGQNQAAAFINDKLGSVFSRNLNSESTLSGLGNQSALAIVKRNVANQDNLQYRTAIRDSKSIKQLGEAIDAIDKMGISIGNYGPALAQLKEINAQFDDMAIKARGYRFAEAQVEAARQRAIDALKNDTLTAFRNLAGLGATVGAQLGSLADQLIKLEANAKSLKIAEGELAGLRDKAIAQAKSSYLSPLTDVSSSIVDQLSSITGILPTPEDTAPLFELLKKSTDPTEQARYISRIQKALTQRYNVEIAALNKTQTAVTTIAALLDNLKLSDLSTLSPEQKLQEAKGKYGTSLLKAQGGDQSALGTVADDARNYLLAAKDFFASSPEYAAIFDNVSGTLEKLNIQFGGTTQTNKAAEDAQAAATAASNTLAASLQQLKSVVEGIAGNQGNTFDQQAAKTSAAVSAAIQAPAKNRQELLEDKKQANIAALAPNASKAQKAAATAANQRLDAQIKAWLYGGDAEADKTVMFQNLTDQVNALNAQIKATKDKTQKAQMQAQVAGLKNQLKALGKVKYQFKADGGWTQGPTIVGEAGPELINFARPTLVTNHSQTRNMLAGGNEAVVTELRKQTTELQALVKLQQASVAAMLERMDKSNSSMAILERKARLEAVA